MIIYALLLSKNYLKSYPSEFNKIRGVITTNGNKKALEIRRLYLLVNDHFPIYRIGC